MRRADAEALALGLLQGPAELVPVSSSGHVAALPWLLRWEVAGWDGARRKQLEVALHAGAGAALLIVLRPKRVRPAAAGRRGAAAGGRRIRARAADRGTARHAGDAGRRAARRRGRAGAGRPLGGDASTQRDAGFRDGLALGCAQTAALMPGVSRNGATLAAARARGFGRADASRLSWEVALPILAGASALKGWRVSQQRSDPSGDTRPLAIGAGAAFASTLAAARAIGIERRAPLWPWALWRAGLAAAILAVRHNRAR